MIDSTAFLLYGHWIKKDEHQNQNRATLFQTEEKCDLVRHEQRVLDRQASPSNPRHCLTYVKQLLGAQICHCLQCALYKKDRNLIVI